MEGACGRNGDTADANLAEGGEKTRDIYTSLSHVKLARKIKAGTGSPLVWACWNKTTIYVYFSNISSYVIPGRMLHIQVVEDGSLMSDHGSF